ncbi:MAG: hypothetical protein IPK80_19520 [Nannocystis sp.]|nr:hypothetical protein [Nannocystis sp.]
MLITGSVALALGVTLGAVALYSRHQALATYQAGLDLREQVPGAPDAETLARDADLETDYGRMGQVATGTAIGGGVALLAGAVMVAIGGQKARSKGLADSMGASLGGPCLPCAFLSTMREFAMTTPIRPQTSLVLLSVLMACAPWPGWPEADCPDTGCEGTTDDGGSGELTGLVTGTSSETTSDDSSGSASESAGETGDATTEAATGEPIEPPTILDVELTPNPIVFNGPIEVTVNAVQSEGVRMTLADGVEVELDAADEPGVFAGEIAVTSGFLNGSHLALLTPWAGEGEGEAVEASYTIALPTPGSELYWETGDLIGAGQVAAMAVLPDGTILELGQRLVDGNSRCYLRQRDKGGGWKQDELVEILPAMDCLAVDIKVSPSGSIFVLAKRVLNNEIRWWLGEIEAWGASPVHRGLGEKNQNAAALAVHGSGMVAVCGDAPTHFPTRRTRRHGWCDRSCRGGVDV